MVYHEIINLIKFHLVMFSLGYAMPSGFFCKYNDAAVRYLQFCSYVYIYGKKGNERDKEYSYRFRIFRYKTRSFLFIIYLFMFFTETEFSSSKHSFKRSLSLRERAVI